MLRSSYKSECLEVSFKLTCDILEVRLRWTIFKDFDAGSGADLLVLTETLMLRAGSYTCHEQEVRSF